MTLKGVLAGLAALLVGSVCIALGFWQLDRLESRRAENARVEARIHLAPAALSGALLDSVRAAPDDFEYRRVRVVGRAVDSASFLLRGRARRGSPGVHLVTPLILPDDSLRLLVDRGWLPSSDASSADPRPYRVASPVEMEGLLRTIPPAPASDRVLTDTVDGYAVRSARSIGSVTQAGRDGLPAYLQRLPDPADSASLPAAEPPPVLDEGPHFSYAFQWFSFAAIAFIGFAVVALRAASRR